MRNRHLVLGAIAVSGLVALGCSGLGGSSGPSTRSASGDKPGDIRVADSKLKKGSRARKPKSVSSEKVKNEYIVKLRPGAAGDLKVGKKSVKTENKKVNTLFGGLDLENSDKLYAKKARNGKLAEYLGLHRTIRIKSRMPEAKLRKKLESNPDVEMVEPVIRMRAAGEPNDPYYAYQWHMQMLDVTKAWETTMGEGVVVAVIDTGVSVGDDGFYKVLPGYDFVEDDTRPEDGNSHGTHVAGTIAQKHNNKIGVVGVAPKASILPVRVLGSDGGGSNTWVANGIVWAADHGANIINLSLGSSSPSEVVADACAYAYEQGVTVIAATGNDGFTDYISYPAAFDTTIAVGSVEARKQIAFYSNQGDQIDLVGPGGDTGADHSGDGYGDGVLQQTVVGGTWEYLHYQGTSMATPHVAGVAALVYAQGVRDPDAIRDVLTQSADDLGKSGWDTTFGHGLVNPVAALAKAASGKPGQSSSASLAVLNKRQKPIGDARAMIGWVTSKPATTNVKGSNGFKSSDSSRVKIHRVAVEGEPGTTVKYTLMSSDGSDRVTEKITVKF